MSTIKGAGVVTGEVRGGVSSSAWRFINEEETLKPQTYGQLVQLYGNGLRTFDIWMWAKRYIDVSTRKMQVIEEGHFWDTLDLSVAIAPNGAGDAITIVSEKGIGRIGFVVHVPAQYLTDTAIPQSYRIVSKTAGEGAWTYVAEALLGTEQIAVQVPIGQKLIVGGSMFAAGTRQPEGLVNDYYMHDHTTRILKETFHMEGGQNALEEWDDLKQSSYGSGLRARNMIKTQLQLRHQINDAILMGYPNLDGITQNNRFSEANSVLGDYGLIPSMYADAMKQYYTGSYTEDQFDVLKFLFASQGITGTSGLFLLGQELGLSIENSGMKFIKEYSGGSDMYDKLKGIGFGIKEVLKNNFKTYLTEVQEFNNPVTYAANGYNFESMGMIFPDSKVTATLNGFDPSGMSVGGKKVSLNHMTVGYLNYGGENRKLVVGNKAGVNGMGIPFSDDWDDMSTFMLCEMMTILLALNQTILVLRTDA
jgi:hypothetical protein